jgi:peptide-methionine (S)-S-oxide reductase
VGLGSIGEAGRMCGHGFKTCVRKATRVVPRAVEEGDAVSIHYLEVLHEAPDVVIRNSRVPEDAPLFFVVGQNKVVKGLEGIVLGMNVGEVKTGVVKPEEAYGAWNEKMTAQVKKSDAPDGLKVGLQVGLSNGMSAVVTGEDDETFIIDANHPLAGKDMSYEVELLSVAKKADVKEACFGGGCFWGVELKFQRLPGVVDTQVGYSNGTVDTVTYEDVCSGQTGHNEVVRVTYNEKEISFEDLVKKFITEFHDPTTLNRQGNDTGTQYRSGIYVTSEDQRATAEAVIESLQSNFSGQIVTEVEFVDKFNVAEEYHQQYLEKGGRFNRPQSAAKNCSDPIRCYG